MADISKISIDERTYDLKDATARGSVETLTGSLGALAYKSQAEGTYTPAGTVSAPTVNVSPTTTTIKAVNNAGTLPSWSASVSDETLSFAFSAGALTTTTNKTVVIGIASATATQPAFSGTPGTVTVS